MAQIINTNISALNAQRNLNRSQATGMQAMQRLSSGLRINSAKDDAAGLGISDRMSSQIRGQNQAARNANDGISMVQTGDGALAEMTNNLQRIRELAVQSSNVTNTASDRAAIDLEVQQRLAEIDRTASTTSFNGQKLLNGSMGDANFQIGANAGETIKLGLSTDVRLAASGKIATMQSEVLGAAKTDGSVTTGTVTAANFSLGDPLQQWGHNTLTAATHLFGNEVDAGTSGTTTLGAVTLPVGSNFTAAVATDGLNVQALTGAAAADYDFSAPADLAQFDVAIGVNSITIGLNADYTNGGLNDLAASQAAMAADITAQLGAAADPLLAATTATIDGNGNLLFTNVGDPTAVQVTTLDTNATGIGLATSTGLTGHATDQEATFTVNSDAGDYAVALTTNLTDEDGVAAEIQNQLNTAAAGATTFTVSWDGSNFGIVDNTIGSSAVSITSDNAAAYMQGWSDTVVSATDGTPAVSANNATFLVDGEEIELNQDFSSMQDMVDSIDEVGAKNGGLQFQLDAKFGADVYTASLGSNNEITITHNDSKTAVVIASSVTGTAASNLTADTAGFANSAGEAGTTAVSFKVDGTQILLDSNNISNADLVTDTQDALNAAFSGTGAVYTVVANDANDGLKITQVNSSAAVVISADDTAGYEGTAANAVTAGITDQTGVTGISAGEITLNDLTINGTSMAGTYASSQALADKINGDVGGVYASVTDGKLSLTSASDINLAGATDAPVMSLNLGVNAADSGSLLTASTLTTAGALDTIQRVDNALNTVTTLRSTLGAVQNRFESVIANLQSTSENLTAARSRIQDADFAEESANLSRTQILQQAGTAMLAQANQSSQGVMALLR